jgi:hypothetical protein
VFTPRLIRTNGLGTGSQARWRTARPRAWANSRERTGSGPVRLTGPSTRRSRIARMMSGQDLSLSQPPHRARPSSLSQADILRRAPRNNRPATRRGGSLVAAQRLPKAPGRPESRWQPLPSTAGPTLVTLCYWKPGRPWPGSWPGIQSTLCGESIPGHECRYLCR